METPERAAFHGRITSGRGCAAEHLAACGDELETLVGGRLFPGSLNILLNRPVRFPADAAVEFDGSGRWLWHGSLSGSPVWLYRWRHAPLHVVEAVSRISLREALGLRDGDSVSLRPDGWADVSVPVVQVLAWSACWLGRRHWYYSNDDYCRRVRKTSIRLGTTQEG